MKLLAISVLSWIAGLGAYLGGLWLFWGQRISSGDLPAVLLWSALAAGVSVVVAFAPAMFALRTRLEGAQSTFWAFPLLGAVLGILPVALILGVWSSDLLAVLYSAEAGLFFCMFATFGSVFGAGFCVVYVRPDLLCIRRRGLS